ncbi:uncharacterized protein LOC126786911 [Argentina anserina]|uniref:uncharacterized protein LOC126786911 n=1 Tax=Argentina anserina TaxID=57926 RepID=UPI00217643F0|nr:uncharacterized protein LOC126786911 [Potentilla anserina]
MAEIQGGNSGSFVMRDYRKGNWTVGETMVLIEAKKMDEERRIMKRSGSGSADHGDQTPRSISKPAELRWKWVEDYCWKKGCLRSQNQCNDKWDNLMRDYKKVREYERRCVVGGENKELPSYWKLEKSERKERNLPTNMVPQIYEALVEVVEKREMGRIVVGAGGGASVSGSISSNPNIGYVVERPMVSGVHQSTVFSPPPNVMQQHLIQAQPIPAVHRLPAPEAAQPPPPLPFSQPIPPVDTDTSEHSDSPAKRRRGGRASGGGGGGGDQQQGISTSGTVSASTSSEVGTAISRGASIIAEALQGCEEREERRHREILSMHERMIQIEETKTEINRQGISGLVDAINKLANSIQALASNNQTQSSAPK